MREGIVYFYNTRITDKGGFFLCAGNREAALGLLKQRRFTAPP
jgi:hypothetical protein